jgi:hypothetical protein
VTVLAALLTALSQAGQHADETPDFDEWMDGLDAWVDARDALSARETELALDASVPEAWDDDLDWGVVRPWRDVVGAWVMPCVGWYGEAGACMHDAWDSGWMEHEGMDASAGSAGSASAKRWER